MYTDYFALRSLSDTATPPHNNTLDTNELAVLAGVRSDDYQVWFIVKCNSRGHRLTEVRAGCFSGTLEEAKKRWHSTRYKSWSMFAWKRAWRQRLDEEMRAILKVGELKVRNLARHRLLSIGGRTVR